VTKKKDLEREFAFSQENFQTLTVMVKDLTGIVLSDRKYDMAYGRVARRLRHYGLRDASEYIDFLNTESGQAELINFVNAMTTNLTSFFRERHHFELLSKAIRQEWLPELRTGERKRLRLWSAGCSSGEEPYTIASVLIDGLGAKHPYDALILATDIDTNMLDKGRSGRYKQDDLVKSEFPSRYVTDMGDGTGEMDAILKDQIRFKQLNLLQKWPFKGPFSIIFCRNVLIYFDPETRAFLAKRYVDMLEPGGILCLGHSESLVAEGLGLLPLGRSAFQKPYKKSSAKKDRPSLALVEDGAL